MTRQQNIFRQKKWTILVIKGIYIVQRQNCRSGGSILDPPFDPKLTHWRWLWTDSLYFWFHSSKILRLETNNFQSTIFFICHHFRKHLSWIFFQVTFLIAESSVGIIEWTITMMINQERWRRSKNCRAEYFDPCRIEWWICFAAAIDLLNDHKHLCNSLPRECRDIECSSDVWGP